MRVGVFAVVFVTGCSLVWDMDPYEGGPSSSKDDAGTIPDASSSGGKEGGACDREVEPNESAFAETEVAVGTTCGTISSPGDIDRFVLTATETFQFQVTTDPTVRVVYLDANANDITYEGSAPSTLTAQPGTNELVFQTAFGSSGRYRINR